MLTPEQIDEKLNIVLNRLDDLEKRIYLYQKDTLTLSECVLYTGLSRRTILNKTSQRAIPHYKQGKMTYFDRKELDSWMKEKKVKTTDEIEMLATNYTMKKRKTYGNP